MFSLNKSLQETVQIDNLQPLLSFLTYTGLPSLDICKQRGIEMVGTIKANRKGLPPDPRRTRGAPKAVRGESITKESNIGGGVYYGKIGNQCGCSIPCLPGEMIIREK